MPRFAAIALLLLFACDTELQNSVVVELRTDLVPGIEFERFELTGEGVLTREVRGPEFVADWTRATAMGELASAGGTRTFQARLVLGDTIVRERPVRVAVAGRTAIQVVFTRDCDVVTCGASEGCLGGSCVSDGCISGNEASCEFEPQCTRDEDCVAASACAPLVCEPPGYCFPSEIDCGVGEYCDPSVGCLALPSTDDAGAMDAGLDAGGMTDASSPDAGSPDAGTSPVRWTVGIESPENRFVGLAGSGTGPCIGFDAGSSFGIEGLAIGRAPGVGADPEGVVTLCLEDTELGALVSWTRTAAVFGIAAASALRFSCEGLGCGWATLVGDRLDFGVMQRDGGSQSSEMGAATLEDMEIGNGVLALARRASVDPAAVLLTDATMPTNAISFASAPVFRLGYAGALLGVASFTAPFDSPDLTASTPADFSGDDQGFAVFALPVSPNATVFRTDARARIHMIAGGLEPVRTLVLVELEGGGTLEGPAGSLVPSVTTLPNEVVLLGLDPRDSLVRVVNPNLPAGHTIVSASAHPVFFDPAGEPVVVLGLVTTDGVRDFGRFYSVDGLLSSDLELLHEVVADELTSCLSFHAPRGYCVGRGTTFTIDGVEIAAPAGEFFLTSLAL